MRQTMIDFNKAPWAKRAGSGLAAILLVGVLSTPALAQQRGQKTFSSPEEASQALLKAAEKNNEKAIMGILGPEGRRIVSSGDETEDADSRAAFVTKFMEMHRLVKEPDGFTTLYIGARNWPVPLPIAGQDHAWYFDTEAGKQEILFRRIGQNETLTIQVCEELAAAQEEYRSAGHHGYARMIFSDKGKHNGLYWKAAPGEPQSPIGPLVASAAAQGYGRKPGDAPKPYFGYYFRCLALQGSQGFAFVAYPAEYRSSGVMTFFVNEDGVVKEKDLGRKSAGLAKAMKEHFPDGSWKTAETAEAGARAK
jgi:hypothetical protein